MRNYIIVGPSNNPSAIRDAVFGAVFEEKIHNAHYIAPTMPKGFRRKLQNLFKRNCFRNIIPATIRLIGELKYRQLNTLFQSSGDNCIVFCPGTHPLERISPSLIRKLRLHKPDCPLILYLVDGISRIAQVSEVPIEKLLGFFEKFDAVYTYDRTDAKRYGFPFIEIPLWISDEKPEAMPSCDLYFCGRDKNRSDLLMQIYDRAAAAGIKCNYHITSLSKTNVRDGVHPSEWVVYKETVKEALKANCILEVLTENNYGATLRYKEAVVYNKKLLTNNPEVFNLPYYDERWMHYFEKAEDIDLEWLNRVEKVNYGYKGDFSAEHFLKNIENTYNANK